MNRKHLLLLASLLTLSCVAALAQVSATATNVVSGLPALINTNTSSNIVSTAIYVPQGKSITFYPHFAGESAGSGNQILKFKIGVATNQMSTTTLNITNTLNSTTAVRGANVITTAQLAGSSWILLSSWQNEDAAKIAYPSNVLYSIPY